MISLREIMDIAIDFIIILLRKIIIKLYANARVFEKTLVIATRFYLRKFLIFSNKIVKKIYIKKS